MLHPIAKKTILHTLLTLKFLLITIKWLFIAYAVAFSIVLTVSLYLGYQYVMVPVRQVQKLQNNNPKESLYMARCRAILTKGDTLRHFFVPLDSISENLQNAVLAAEDDGFFTHPGFDIGAILAAIEYNRVNEELKRGASTLTQQLAKNLFLSSEKSFERKLKELLYTILMEKYLGKKRILELYLNYAQWGKTLFGCEAASQYYYRKPCKSLTRREAARLAAVLAMPNKVSPLNEASTYIPKRIAVIAYNLLLHHKIDDSGYIELTGNPPPQRDSADSVRLNTPGTAKDSLQKTAVPDSAAVKAKKAEATKKPALKDTTTSKSDRPAIKSNDVTAPQKKSTPIAAPD
ncbi:MAG: monofunctional biosynthetic peptidoglycan transglycosylase [Chitinispirillaceae bacterium]|nr:monofunctional biosynthetic peptidoglycan transglycosylase [Chitinispirillaceae bacterium]